MGFAVAASRRRAFAVGRAWRTYMPCALWPSPCALAIGHTANGRNPVVPLSSHTIHSLFVLRTRCRVTKLSHYYYPKPYSLHSLMIDILPKLKNSYMIDIFRLHLEFPRRRLFRFVFAITPAPRMKRQRCHPSALAP